MSLRYEYRPELRPLFYLPYLSNNFTLLWESRDNLLYLLLVVALTARFIVESLQPSWGVPKVQASVFRRRTKQHALHLPFAIARISLGALVQIWAAVLCHHPALWCRHPGRSAQRAAKNVGGACACGCCCRARAVAAGEQCALARAGRKRRAYFAASRALSFLPIGQSTSIDGLLRPLGICSNMGCSKERSLVSIRVGSILPRRRRMGSCCKGCTPTPCSGNQKMNDLLEYDLLITPELYNQGSNDQWSALNGCDRWAFVKRK